MTITKKLFITYFAFITSLTQAICWQDPHYNHKAFQLYIDRAIETLDHVEQQLQWELHGSREIIRTGKGHADELYPRQKAALKAIVKELKVKARTSNNKMYISHSNLFKHEIYKQWKRTFKKNYVHSLASNDPLPWGWLHQKGNSFCLDFFFLE